jgi:CubicO group peptidase (beta-lactamase class C family)
MRRLFISFLVLFVWVKTFSQSDSKEIQNKVDLFDKYIQLSMPLWKTTGLSVAVVKDGKVIFKKGYGVTNIDKPQPFTTSTISFCASTKSHDRRLYWYAG